MDNNLGPTRLPPKQLSDKIPGGAGVSTSDIQDIAKDPAGAVTNKIVGAVSSGAQKSDFEKRFNTALSLAHQTGRVPTQVQYRLSSLEAGILIGVSATIDIIDWIAGWFSEVILGEIIVIIIDLLYGVLVAAYCRFRLKLPFASHFPIYISVLGAELIGFIPIVNVTWWADAWLITHLVRKEDRALHQQLIATIEKEKQQEDLKRRMAQFEIDQQEQRMRPNFVDNNNDEGRVRPKYTDPIKPNFRPNPNQNPNTPGRIAA